MIELLDNETFIMKNPVKRVSTVYFKDDEHFRGPVLSPHPLVRVVGLTNYRLIFMKNDSDIYTEEKKGFIIKKGGNSVLSIFFKDMFYNLSTFNQFAKVFSENNKKIWNNYIENGKATKKTKKAYNDPGLIKNIAIITEIGLSNDNSNALALKKITPENIHEVDSNWNGYYFKLFSVLINGAEEAAALRGSGKNLRSRIRKFNTSLKMTMVITPIKNDQSDWYGLIERVSADSAEINRTFSSHKSVREAYQAIYESL